MLGELRAQSGLIWGSHFNGNSNDFSGNNNHGADTDIIYSQANGRFGQGAGFNGSSSIITATINSGLNSDFVFRCRVKISSQPSNYIFALMSSNVVSYSNYWINLSYSDSAGVKVLNLSKFDGTNNPQASFQTTLQTGVSYDVVGLKSGGVLYLFLDGLLVAQANDTTTSVPTYSGFTIGGQTSQTRFLNGGMDEVAVFSIAKPADWVRKQYSLGRFGEL